VGGGPGEESRQPKEGPRHRTKRGNCRRGITRQTGKLTKQKASGRGWTHKLGANIQAEDKQVQRGGTRLGKHVEPVLAKFLSNLNPSTQRDLRESQNTSQKGVTIGVHKEGPRLNSTNEKKKKKSDTRGGPKKRGMRERKSLCNTQVPMSSQL